MVKVKCQDMLTGKQHHNYCFKWKRNKNFILEFIKIVKKESVDKTSC